MKHISLPINIVKAVIFLIIASTFFIGIQAQTQKPRKLREEILKEQKKQAQEEEPVKTETSRKGDPPQVGATVLKPANPRALKNVTLVYLEHSDMLMFDQNLHPNLQILKGNVRFKHDNALLYCDSAHFDDAANSFDAYG
ncbi:MAG: hypothetical protein GX102_04875, partial [Porphyromonadaceae bacterium]|nr:hypothetical protein [Porphyromonadaceae bacterium]